MRGYGSLATAITSLKLTRLQTWSLIKTEIAVDSENYPFGVWLDFSPGLSKTATKIFDG